MTQIPEEDLYLFPPRLFLCSDNLHPIHFILSLKQLTNVQQDELVKLLNHCGAELSLAVKDATGHSVVIVDHDEVVNVKAPAFTLKYLEACFKKQEILDISDYRQDATGHIARNIQCMDVVYHRTKSWHKVLTVEEKQWFDTMVVKSIERVEATTNQDLMLLSELCERSDTVTSKYKGCFPPRLFMCAENTHSMHFILSLEHMLGEQQETLMELLDYCGAEASLAMEDATEHSAVIVDHDDVVNVKAPAFTLKYLEDCLTKSKIHNISDYRQNTTSHIAGNIDCMDVVYHRKTSWDSVLTKEDKQWFDDQFNSSRSTGSSDGNSCHEQRASQERTPVDVRSKDCEQRDGLELEGRYSKNHYVGRLLSDEDSEVEEMTDHQTTEVIRDHRDSEKKSCERQNNSNKRQLSSDDDSDLENTVIENRTRERTRNTTNNLNNNYEEAECSKARRGSSNTSTHQTTEVIRDHQDSEKKSCERQNNSNKRQLSSDDDSDLENTVIENRTRERTRNTTNNLNNNYEEAECSKVRRGSSNTSTHQTTEVVRDHRDSEKKSCERQNNSNKRQLSSDDDSDLENKVIENRTRERTRNTTNNLNNNYEEAECSKARRGSSNTSTILKPNLKCGSGSQTSSKWSFLDEFQSENSSDEESSHYKKVEAKKRKKFFSFDAGNEELFSTKNKKRSRAPYSLTEQSKILKYIQNNNEYSRVKGRVLWQIMERKKVCPNRTWQSIKEHFLKKIIHNIEAYDFLTKEEKKKLKKQCSKM